MACGWALKQEKGLPQEMKGNHVPWRQREEHMYKSGGENGAGEWNEQK